MKKALLLNLNDKEYSTLHWLAVLLENREFETNSPFSLSKYSLLASASRLFLFRNHSSLKAIS